MVGFDRRLGAILAASLDNCPKASCSAVDMTTFTSDRPSKRLDLQTPGSVSTDTVAHAFNSQFTAERFQSQDDVC